MKRWPLRVQQVVVYGGFIGVLVWKGHLASFFDNRTALSKGAAMLGAGILGLAATQRLIRRPWIREAVRLVPIVAVAALVVAPSIRDKRVDEALPIAAPIEAAPTATTVVVPPRVGTIAGIGHRASGRAALYSAADGGHVVRLENFSVENGPDYQVYVVPGLNQRRPNGGTHLGALKGSSGNQNYAVPSTFDVVGPHTLLIWCRSFSVPVANASIPN